MQEERRVGDTGQAAHYRAGKAVFFGTEPGNALPAPCAGSAGAGRR